MVKLTRGAYASASKKLRHRPDAHPLGQSRKGSAVRPRLFSLAAGVDLVPLTETQQLLERFGDRFLAKCFGRGELAYCLRQRDPVPHLAARLAAKEAFIKAVHGRCPTVWREIEVLHGPSGEPRLHLSGSVARSCRALPLGQFQVSLSHSGGYAIAQVLGMIEMRRDGPYGS